MAFAIIATGDGDRAVEKSDFNFGLEYHGEIAERSNFLGRGSYAPGIRVLFEILFTTDICCFLVGRGRFGERYLYRAELSWRCQRGGLHRRAPRFLVQQLRQLGQRLESDRAGDDRPPLWNVHRLRRYKRLSDIPRLRHEWKCNHPAL